MIIGLTGGIACGKSAVSSLLKEYGSIIIDADLIAREVVQIGSPTLSEIVSVFGLSILNTDGTLNRKVLGSLVFANVTNRNILDGIMHPSITRLLLDRVTTADKLNPCTLVVADIPLLYEIGLDCYFGEVVVVHVPFEVQLSRLMSRNGLSESEALSRINSQMSLELKKSRASHLLDNSGTLSKTRSQIKSLLRGKGLL